MEINAEVCTSLVYWKSQSKYYKKFHVQLKYNQTSRLNLWYSKPEFIVSTTKYLHPYVYSKIMCLRMFFIFP
jgi:hypothetical protein